MFTQRRTDELRTILQRRHTLLKVRQNIFITIHSSSMALQDKSKKPVEIIRLMSGLQSATTEEMKENQSVIQYIFSLQWYKITQKKQGHPKFSPGSIIKENQIAKFPTTFQLHFPTMSRKYVSQRQLPFPGSEFYWPFGFFL